MTALKGLRSVVLCLVAILLIGVAYVAVLHGVAWVSDNFIGYVFAAAEITFAVCLLILVPLSLFRATRKISCFGLYAASFVFGTCAWLMGFSTTLFYWGMLGVIIALGLGIVGIVPLGIIAAAFYSDWLAVGFLLGALVLTYGSRVSALALATKIDRDEQQIFSQGAAGSIA
jgi:hypothetical protein